MTTDNRTNEPTEAQTEAAAKAMWERTQRKNDPAWGDLDYGVKEEYRKDARAALVAAQEAAPQAEQCCQHPKCPGGSICCCASFLPSSGVDEDALAEVIESHVLGEPNGGTATWAWVNCSCGHRIGITGVTREHVVALGRKHQARAVVAYLRGES